MIRTYITVKGMMCANCEKHINDAIKNNFDIKKVDADKGERLVTVISNDPLDKAKVKRVITECGYEYIDMTQEEVIKKGFRYVSAK